MPDKKTLKKQIDKMPNSAYKSMMLVKHGFSKSKPAVKEGKYDGLMRWEMERWENLTPRLLGETKFYPCGKKSKEQVKLELPSVCRPSKQINKETPKPLSNKITKKQIQKAVNIKKKRGGRIKWSEL